MQLSSGRKFSIYGHRGSRGTHPENTFAAFREAIDAGVDYIELDIQLSSDQIPIVIHDPELTPNNYCSREGQPLKPPFSVGLLSRAELAAVDAGTRVRPEFSNQIAVPGEPIPSLSGVFNWLESRGNPCRLNIEIKRDAAQGQPQLLPSPTLLAKTVVAVVNGCGLVSETIIQSFDMAVMKEVSRLAPDGIRAMLFETPMDFVSIGRSVGAQIIAPDFKLLSLELVAQLHSAGFEVVPWTVNEERDWARLIQWGVDGIITDYPRKLKGFANGA